MRRQTQVTIGFAALALLASMATGQEALDRAQLRQEFGEQIFVPEDGFVVRPGEPLPRLVWKDPEWIEDRLGPTPIRTRWFNASFDEVKRVEEIGRYYVYGEVSGPDGSTLRRAMTICSARAEEWPDSTNQWRDSEEGAVELAAFLDAGKAIEEPRVGQWMMENATRHVRLKRKLMGLDDVAPVKVRPRPLAGDPRPVLREGTLDEAGVDRAQVRRIERSLDAWYAQARKPTAIVVARHGVIVVNKAYGALEGQPVTVDTPMLLHSAMKPLIGLQLAMYADRGHVKLDEPIGKYLPDFNSEADRRLTFRAGHVHATGIHFPWPLAFSRLFYFRSWQDSMISFRTREWPAGENRRYGVVGIILAVRALELLSGRNYWDAMEREIFEPLGIENILPGGTGFSAESLARIGVLLANRGKYGHQEFLSEQAYQAMVPTSLTPYFPKIDMTYGIGLQQKELLLGSGSYGHGGGCGTQILVYPEQHLVFAMVRNEQGDGYKELLAGVLAKVKALSRLPTEPQP